MIPEDSLAYTHFVAVQKLVASLFECIGQIPKARPKRGWSLVVFGKEFLVAKVYALYHVLQCLRRQQAPASKAGSLFQLRQVSHEPELARVLAEHAIVSLVQGNEVIIHTCKGVYISVEILVAVTPAIQLVFVGQIHGQPLKK